MKRVASPKWALAAVVLATVTGLALLSVVAVEAQQAGQSTSEEEIAAYIRAELEARLAQIQHQLQEQMAELQVVREGQLVELQERLAQLNAGESQMRERLRAELQDVYQELQNSNAERALRRAQEVQEQALVAAERAQERASRAVSIRRLGSCDSYGEMLLNHAEDLELSDEQLAAIRDRQRASRRDGIERRADIEVGEMDLEALYDADNPDLAAIRAQLEALAMLQVDEQMAGFQLRQDVRATLTPAQLEAFDNERSGDGNVRIYVSGWSGARSLGRIGC